MAVSDLRKNIYCRQRSITFVRCQNCNYRATGKFRYCKIDLQQGTFGMCLQSDPQQVQGKQQDYTLSTFCLL